MISAVAFLALLTSGPKHGRKTVHVKHHAVVTKEAPLPPFKLDPRVIGTWWPQVDTLKLTWKGNSITQQPLGPAMDQIRDSLGFMNMTFRPDGTFIAVDPNGGPSHGTYRVIGNSIKTIDFTHSGEPVPVLSLSPDATNLSLSFTEKEVSISFTMIKM